MTLSFNRVNILMLVLGIETSCDETAVALYHADKGLIGNITYTQSAHAVYGGVVPELASREHIKKIIPLIQDLLKDCAVQQTEVQGVAYTKGPGLAGALLVGAMVGRAIAFALEIPAIGIHHLEGHLLAPFLEEDHPQFPFLALLVSGGHTELISVFGLGKYVLLGETVDDAAGEAFDKTAKVLGLGYPGGAALAKLAEKGDPNRFHFPRPMTDRPGLDFSFSGLKTFALRTIQATDGSAQSKADIACAFQNAVVETLLIKCKRALKQTGLKQLVIAGGVGANLHLRNSLQVFCTTQGVQVFYPRPEFCTDNAAMIAYAGCLHLLNGEREDLAVAIRPRWSLQDIQTSGEKTAPTKIKSAI